MPAKMRVNVTKVPARTPAERRADQEIALQTLRDARSSLRRSPRGSQVFVRTARTV